MNEAELRKRFEEWIVSGSFGWIGRIAEDATTDKAGEYYSPAVQVAWMAWCEASRQAPAMEIISGTVSAFGLRDTGSNAE